VGIRLRFSEALGIVLNMFSSYEELEALKEGRWKILTSTGKNPEKK